MPRRTRKPGKKQIDQYDYNGASRANNPPVGLVTPKTDRDAGKKIYAYDPHIDPSLQFESHRSQIERIIDDGIAAETIEERSLVPRPIFVPMAGAKDGWMRLAKNLKAGSIRNSLKRTAAGSRCHSRWVRMGGLRWRLWR